MGGDGWGTQSGMINHVSAGLPCSQSTRVHSISFHSNLGGRQGYPSRLLIASNRKPILGSLGREGLVLGSYQIGHRIKRKTGELGSQNSQASRKVYLNPCVLGYLCFSSLTITIMFGNDQERFSRKQQHGCGWWKVIRPAEKRDSRGEQMKAGR